MKSDNVRVSRGVVGSVGDRLRLAAISVACGMGAVRLLEPRRVTRTLASMASTLSFLPLMSLRLWHVLGLRRDGR